MELTKKQIRLMQHTVSGHNRNWFGTGFDTDDSAEFEKLVTAGLATSEKPPAWMGDEVIYRLTPAGKAAIL